MANFDLSPTKNKENSVFGEVRRHIDLGFQETDRRTTGKNRSGSISFNEADELFRSWIDENNWPYDALLFDPRIFTFIFEKTSRLISNKPKGQLIPREGSDVLSAKINNILLDYQWDQANHGGTMVSKWALMDINTRKYGAAFALCKWRYETSPKGKVLFDGPEMQVLNNRDIAHDLTATAIEDCNWFLVRQYVTLQDLMNINDQNSGKPIYKNLDALRAAIGKEEEEANGGGGDSRGSNWISRNRSISKLETDPVGKDPVFKTIEIVTEYRKNRWITIAPKHGIVLRDIENPYENNQIPVVMLRYYQIDDDLYGISEIEPVKGLQKAINAVLCQYVDEINQQLYTPVAIGPGVRQHTLEWGKGAKWIMNNPQSDFRLVESRSNAAQFFQSTYSVLVAAMMNTLGESSLGISNIQPMQNDKTATEVKALQLQRNARDQMNQTCLSDAIKRMMMLWHSMNQRLLFSNPNERYYVLRIVGKDALDWFYKQNLADIEIPQEQIIAMYETEVSNPEELQEVMEQPKYPVEIKEDGKKKTVTKLKLEDKGKSALLYIEPRDLEGMFDFSVDVVSMSASATEEERQARQSAVSLLATNPNILMLLSQEGVKPKFKELFVTWLQDLGFTDAEKYFEKASPGAGGMMPQMPSPSLGGGENMASPMQELAAGLAGATQPQQKGSDEAMAMSGALPAQVDLGTPNPNSYNQATGMR